ncbi:MAG: hypothetical protein GWO07_15000 [Candidatus Dadabacteria bacterium]|nr:hypothetical protein [Candidatus Dadabacteria bacterium]NIS10019.1 hypothetical protein [Candidatus Dadabacteria bacterium]NIV42025.1 hypothetical protein [Candidatus Dadabacteria bacterium]NIX15235.1 hypothetical protein [Candidatus Dadabacteria bacterium]NIY22991.1 hypothetical protein [Candidatus Dadabacteria bacterium]
MRAEKYSYVILFFLLIFGFETKNSFSINIVESLKLKAIPEEILDTECPLFLTFQMQIIAGVNMYKTEHLPVKYRLVGDNGYASSWRQFSIPKGEIRTDVFRRKIDPAAIAQKTDIDTNPTLKRDKDKAFYKGWSAVELIYQDEYRKVYNMNSNKADFYIECKAFPDI